MSRESNLFDKEMKKVGRIMGVSCAVYRPDYTAADQTGTLALSDKFRMDTQALRYLEPAFPGVYAFEIFGDRKNVQAGDIIIPSATADGPAVTVMHVAPMKAMVGILTDSIGKIRESVSDTVLYTNVRFQWVGPSFPGSGLNDALEDTVKIPKRKIAMYKRQGLGLSDPVRPGMRLVETNNDLEYVWHIVDVVTVNNITVCAVRENVE